MVFEMLEFTWVDWIKILIAVASIISIYYFRRQISKLIADLITGSDTMKYQGKTVSEIVDEVDKRLKEVIG